MRGRFAKTILDNAETLRRMKARIDASFRRRDESPAWRSEWEAACAAFHATWDTLAFPGGYEYGLAKLRDGERNAVEAALCFLECRPYFFRSGYMYTKLMRLMKRAELSEAQDRRFDAVIVRDEVWRLSRRHGAASREVAEFREFLKRIGYDPPTVQPACAGPEI